MKDPKVIAENVIRSRYNGDLPAYDPVTAMDDEPSIGSMVAELWADEVSMVSLIEQAAADAQTDLRAPAEGVSNDTFTLTDRERSMVLSALIDKQLEVEGYLRGSKIAKTPTPTDSCCAFHLARHEERRNTYVALRDRRRRVDALIALFADPSPRTRSE